MTSWLDRDADYRVLAFAGFLLTIPPLIWLYYRHAVQRIPGAYTYYAFFEWSLVFWDLSFDAVSAVELSHLQVRSFPLVHLSSFQIAVIDTTRSKADGSSKNGWVKSYRGLSSFA